MKQVLIGFITLSPNLSQDALSRLVYPVLYRVLNKHAKKWGHFFQRRKSSSEWSLGFDIVAKRGTRELEVHGPATSRAYKMVDYSIWLPVRALMDLETYTEAILSGIEQVLIRHGVPMEEIAQIKLVCMHELGLDATASETNPP